ncbi:MAG: peptidase M64 N-terminal domain-containing protein, partial [Ignavibacteriaceae bacterium]
MKKLFNQFALLLFFTPFVLAQDLDFFNEYFIDETMRIDYYHIGNSEEEIITIDQIYKYGIWAGSRNYLIDDLNLGRYCAKIYD